MTVQTVVEQRFCSEQPSEQQSCGFSHEAPSGLQ